MNTSKICDRCGVDKRLEAYPRSPNTEDGLQHVCRSCTRYANGKPGRSKRTKSAILDSRRRLATVAKQYGSDAVPKYKALVAESKGACVICGRTDKILHLDHNHTTNDIRGLLCSPCNTGLGFFQDSPTLLTKAAQYLKKRGHS